MRSIKDGKIVSMHSRDALDFREFEAKVVDDATLVIAPLGFGDGSVLEVKLGLVKKQRPPIDTLIQATLVNHMDKWKMDAGVRWVYSPKSNFKAQMMIQRLKDLEEEMDKAIALGLPPPKKVKVIPKRVVRVTEIKEILEEKIKHGPVRLLDVANEEVVRLSIVEEAVDMLNSTIPIVREWDGYFETIKEDL